MPSRDPQSRKSIAIWAALVVTAIVLVAVSVYGSLQSGASPGRPESAIVISHYYLERRSCGGNITVATVRLDNGNIVRAGAAKAATLRNGMHVTVERRSATCVAAPYTILLSVPPNSSFQRTPKNTSAAYFKR